MCGITGIVEQRNVQPTITNEILHKMTDVIYHRGPDDFGHWIDSTHRCGFGFRRLSIIDISSAGHQPMHSDDGRFTIVFNGEIYNHQELRKEFEADGIRYKSQTDTETILNGFRKYGVSFFGKMAGMWAIAIWDSHTNTLTCSRDRIGVKPFYYTFQNGRFIFGSEIKSILQHPSFKAELNLDELPMYMSFSATSPNHTLFRNIHKIPAGHILTLSNSDSISIERYWSVCKSSEATKAVDPEIAQEEILRLLRQSVKDRMMSDVPFGVFLSGGVDSSVNVALMAELMDRPVDTFTVGFSELEKYNELEYARKIRDIFSTNHHEILIDSAMALPELETIAWHQDEPNGDPVCIPLYFLSKLTRESGTTVIQVGEGSDEQFVGYPWMMRELSFYNTYWKWFMALPQWLRTTAYRTVKPFLMQSGNYLMLDYVRRGAENNQQYWGGGINLTPSHLELLLGNAYKEYARRPVDLPEQAMESYRQFGSGNDRVQEMAYFEFYHRLPELLLMRVDKMTMAHSLEARVPFLDYRLVEYTFSLSQSTKLAGNDTTKYLLKKAVEPLLPHDIIYRKKQGFAAPVSEWFRTTWYEYAKDTILSSDLVTTGIIDKFGIEHIFYLHSSGKKNLGAQIYLLLNLSLWYRRFFS